MVFSVLKWLNMAKVATAAVIWRDQKILIAQRYKDDYWEFPGGKLDPGETPEECVIREIKEELDIDVTLGLPFDLVEGRFRGQDMILHGFHAYWIDRTIKLNVHLDTRLVKVDELSHYSFVEEDREIIRQLDIMRENPDMIPKQTE